MASVLESYIEQTLNKYGEFIVKGIKDRLRQQNKVATGSLLNSISFRINRLGQSIQLEILANDYLEWVDKGRSPGKQPPISSILKWVQARGIRSKNKTTLSSKQSILKQQQQTAFQIAKSIARRGIRPSNIVSPVLQEADSIFEIEIGQGVAKFISQELKEVLSESTSPKIKVSTTVSNN